MRGITATATLKRPLRTVWTEASDPSRWGALFGGGMRRKVVCRVAGADGRPAQGAAVAVRYQGGGTAADGQVLVWDPPRGFKVTLHRPGWFAAFHGTVSLKLSELDDNLTSAELSVQFVFLNRLIELASLVLPVGGSYKSQLERALKRLAAPPG